MSDSAQVDQNLASSASFPSAFRTQASQNLALVAVAHSISLAHSRIFLCTHASCYPRTPPVTHACLLLQCWIQSTRRRKNAFWYVLSLRFTLQIHLRRSSRFPKLLPVPHSSHFPKPDQLIRVHTAPVAAHGLDK